MRQEEFQVWYDDLLERARSVPKVKGSYEDFPAEGPARAWATEAEAALESVFPEGHSARQSWARVLKDPKARHFADVFAALVGVFEGAANLIRTNRLTSLVDAIRIESESELLDQARILVDADHRAAATVIAGGALEAHLRHYVHRHAIPISGEGSISRYNGAVGQARKAKPNLYNANDGKLVEGWGGFRNEAAHQPGNLARSKEEVRRLIEGIREFIGRTG